MPLARCGPISRTSPTGKRRGRKMASQDCREPQTTPRSTRAPAPWSWKAATCMPGLCSGSVYDGQGWRWVNYPVKCSRYFEQRLSSEAWEQKSPLLVLRPHSAEVHFPQTKEIAAKKVRESKLDPNLVTVAVDLNVKQLAVITVRQHEQII